MSIQNDERTITILRMVAEGNLGTNRTGLFAKLDTIIEEFGDKHTVKQIIQYLLDKGYVKIINEKFEKIHGNQLDYKAYQITEQGKTHLSKSQTPSQPINYHQNNFGNIYGSNISIDSQYVSQIIDNQDDETKQLLKELLEATEKKDKPAILKALGYIADKSLDLLVAIIAGGAKL